MLKTHATLKLTIEGHTRQRGERGLESGFVGEAGGGGQAVHGVHVRDRRRAPQIRWLRRDQARCSQYLRGRAAEQPAGGAREATLIAGRIQPLQPLKCLLEKSANIE